MPRYIDAETIKSRIGELCINNYELFSETIYERIIGVIEAVPTADVQEVKHGRWREKPTIAYCSNCKVHLTKSFLISLRQTYKYCPNCGAKMDGDKNDS